MEVLTQQEIFDRAVGGVLKQGTASRDRHGACVFRGTNGTKCAVGQIIPDVCVPLMHGLIPAEDIDQITRILHRDGGINVLGEDALLIQLGWAHDTAYSATITGDAEFLEHFRENARKVGTNFRLCLAVLDAPLPS